MSRLLQGFRNIKGGRNDRRSKGGGASYMSSKKGANELSSLVLLVRDDRQINGTVPHFATRDSSLYQVPQGPDLEREPHRDRPQR